MTALIGDLVERFERGGLTRRELILALSALLGTRGAAAAPTAESSGLSAAGIDHVSVLASDLERSVDFYRRLLGLTVLGEDRAHGIVRLGRKRVLVSLRKEAPYGTVDHFGVKIEDFNRGAVTAALSRLGMEAHENWQYGYYLKDPDGVNVQLL